LVEYSAVQGGYPGEGNIDAEPRFVDPESGDFRLAEGSPCIDAADNTAVPEGIETDLDGNPRFVDDLDTVDTGKPGRGHDQIVDMGSYEFQPRCDVEVCQLTLKYKAKFQGLRAQARLCSANGEPKGPGWRVCFQLLTLEGEPVAEQCKATRRNGRATVRFADLTCGKIYRVCVASIQSPEGEDCTPLEPTCERQIIGCVGP